MDKTYNIFKKFLPIIIGVAFVGFVFSLLTLIYYYDDGTISVNFRNVIPIFSVIIVIGAIALSVYFSLKIKTLHISKLKKNFAFSKFASSLTAALAAALFFFDFFRFVQMPTTSSPLRILRLLVFVPFIAHFIVGMMPSKIRKKKIVLPVWLKPATAICAIAWAIFGLLMTYFWNGLSTTNIFRLIHIFYYVLLIAFFLFEAKFELLTPMPRAFVMSSTILFVYSFILTGSITLAKVLGGLPSVIISDFELFLTFSIGIYALSRMISVQQTLKYVMNRNTGSHHRHHHHHHHHHHHSSSSGENGTSENNTVEKKD